MGNTIVIDVNAAGYGWFVDSTPFTDVEFGLKLSDVEKMAFQTSPAFGRMDLLTVVMHEVGHVLGLADLDPNAPNLMSGTLDAGIRVNPEAENGRHKSPNLVSLTPHADSKGKDFSLAALGRNGKTWLSDFLADGAEKMRHSSFEPKDKIQIWLLDDKEEKK